MQSARRKFLKYTSIMGLISLTNISLFGEAFQLQPEEIGSTHMDENFDPDNWL